MISKDSIIADIIDAIETQFIGVENDVKSYYQSIFKRRLDTILDIINSRDTISHATSIPLSNHTTNTAIIDTLLDIQATHDKIKLLCDDRSYTMDGIDQPPNSNASDNYSNTIGNIYCDSKPDSQFDATDDKIIEQKVMGNTQSSYRPIYECYSMPGSVIDSDESMLKRREGKNRMHTMMTRSRKLKIITSSLVTSKDQKSIKISALVDKSSTKVSRSRSRSQEKQIFRIRNRSPSSDLQQKRTQHSTSESNKSIVGLDQMHEKHRDTTYISIDDATYAICTHTLIQIWPKDIYTRYRPDVHYMADIKIPGMIVNFKVYRQYEIGALVYVRKYTGSLHLKFFVLRTFPHGIGISFDTELTCIELVEYQGVFICATKEGLQGFDMKLIRDMFRNEHHLNVIRDSAQIYTANNIADIFINGSHIFSIDRDCRTVNRVNMSFKSRKPLSNRNGNRQSKSVVHDSMSEANTKLSSILKAFLSIAVCSDTRLTILTTGLEILTYIDLFTASITQMTDDGKRLALLSHDNRLRLFDTSDSILTDLVDVDMSHRHADACRGPYTRLFMMADGRLLVYGCACKPVYVNNTPVM